MIIADFTNCSEDTVTASGVLYQYDYNQELKIQGLNIAGSAQVHFSFQQSFGEAVRIIGEAEDGDLTVQIPNFLLKGFLSCRGEYYIWAFVYVADSEAGETIKRIRIRIIARPKPQDYSEPEYKDALDQMAESLAEKLDKKQGTSNSGKFLAVGSDGNITLVDGNGGGSGGGGTVSVQVASTTTGEPGTDAKVTNSGDSQNVKLNFVIPRGNPGAKGDTGDIPNLTIGTVQTLEPSQNATASITGTTENPVLNLGIPKGEKGDPGEDAESGSSATPRQQMQNTETTVTLQPNILYVFPEMASLTVTLAEPENTNIANEYHFFFTSGTTATTLTLNDVLSDTYSIDANMKYEVSILEGVAYIKGVATDAT